MKNDLGFCIITVTFNNLGGLKKTWSSIEKQYFSGFNWLVVDGGSTDGTRQWLDELECPKVAYISESDRGIYDAMNKGIRYAKASYKNLEQYFIFLNSGDELYKEDTLDRVKETIVNNKFPKMLFFSSERVFPGRRKIKIRRPGSPWRLYIGSIGEHQSIVVRSDALEFYDECYSLSADYDWQWKIIKSLQPSEILRKGDLIQSRFRVGGVSTSRRGEAILEDCLIKYRNGMWFLPVLTMAFAHYFYYIFKRLLYKLPKTQKNYNTSDKK